MENTKLMIEVPTSIMEEVNKYLAKKSEGKSQQGMKRAIVSLSLFNLLEERGWKISKKASKDCIEIINNTRFKI